MDSNALVGGGDDVDVVWHHVLLRDLELCNWDTHDDGINRAAPSHNSQHQQENEAPREDRETKQHKEPAQGWTLSWR